VRKLLNKLLAPTGYRIERISRFDRELQSLMRRPERRLKFVQIGANDGMRFDDLYRFVTRHPCSGIVVEPLPDLFERLRANYADYPLIVPVNKAIHETSGVQPLFRVAPEALSGYSSWATGIASFDRSHLLRHGIAPADIREQPVACMPLMQLLQETATLDADLLQIDAEGYDSAILRMTDFTRFRPHLIKYEHKAMTVAERSAHEARLARHGYRSVVEGADTVVWQSARS
jgi:FkbM family methyltransferase